MTRDWDELSEVWEDSHNPSEPPAISDGSYQRQARSRGNSPEMSTVRVWNNKGDLTNSEGGPRAKPWENGHLKDIFSPLSLERLFKPPFVQSSRIEEPPIEQQAVCLSLAESRSHVPVNQSNSITRPEYSLPYQHPTLPSTNTSLLPSAISHGPPSNHNGSIASFRDESVLVPQLSPGDDASILESQPTIGNSQLLQTLPHSPDNHPFDQPYLSGSSRLFQPNYDTKTHHYLESLIGELCPNDTEAVEEVVTSNDRHMTSDFRGSSSQEMDRLEYTQFAHFGDNHNRPLNKQHAPSLSYSEPNLAVHRLADHVPVSAEPSNHTPTKEPDVYDLNYPSHIDFLEDAFQSSLLISHHQNPARQLIKPANFTTMQALPVNNRVEPLRRGGSADDLIMLDDLQDDIPQDIFEERAQESFAPQSVVEPPSSGYNWESIQEDSAPTLPVKHRAYSEAGPLSVSKNDRETVARETRPRPSHGGHMLYDSKDLAESFGVADPSWKMAQHLDLSSSGIASLHNLKKHASSLRSLRANDNNLVYLDGIPESVTVLHVQNNRLSNLTIFATLQSLQFLDICGNSIDDLSGLMTLPNLRELHAANNKIKHCGHIAYLTRLVRANLRGNKITSIDLSSHGTSRLEFLDLSCNEITVVAGIERLNSLRELFLDQNHISEIAVAREIVNLEVLSLNDNEIQHFDGKFWPALRRLSLDRNRIIKFTGEKSLTRLQTLSLERQEGPNPEIKYSALKRLADLRISGNAFRDLNKFRYNSRLRHLEAQCTHILDIPQDFTRKLPHLEHLNLSDNGIHDVSNLRNMMGLRSLILMNNQIEDFRMLRETLKHLSGLEVLDTRFNPISVQFYNSRDAAADESQWANTDEVFCKNLPDKEFVRRTFYRSSLISILRGSLRSLDNIPTGEPDKKVANYQMNQLRSSLQRSMSSNGLNDR
ncbi:hypothetical protein DFS34DRAFT_633749 [Phlyctochytrium arcticum]|nr:hypothetical protein DFS34DRAFT_640833 [Phlyctochytrium arcticum]KAI9092101.1 hypothetical protein DFS34DRAFT_633749 [Phlyctochytrium arcticum]